MRTLRICALAALVHLTLYFALAPGDVTPAPPAPTSPDPFVVAAPTPPDLSVTAAATEIDYGHLSRAELHDRVLDAIISDAPIEERRCSTCQKTTYQLQIGRVEWVCTRCEEVHE